ncbi:uncharacterized protein CLUP02_09129 [Colletotrichum lupini]|uniref:Uncharacterized protein n=3 Tax=Colletotrichum acutatum species complex TaxID=2707335 RepID=A0A9Q8WHJ2_9PEZI|nr:uncharacterized protein CLUP02_09129 [Colletotrichum lupini]XP_060307085.1 uncharacterized protein CCOS01_14456 [Colletotrichum costaricense]XP_060379684.1 uncharacterized protein CTAM01_09596 [Colletotrichum tamarilloi]KAI3544277.1 hypothetical protein CSPX01_05729 [Colletotrichum filicis]KAK1492969.1 hypothetical protein CTAM01_09596 [Colletotrichum tamarilloi]KAK1513514.1 hypothetical protein CCOS01_14456 [Colletotrichum costaricense]UQC83634.1 hypothetical protein CLUP02_09129 [Colleto
MPCPGRFSSHHLTSHVTPDKEIPAQKASQVRHHKGTALPKSSLPRHTGIPTPSYIDQTQPPRLNHYNCDTRHILTGQPSPEYRTHRLICGLAKHQLILILSPS